MKVTWLSGTVDILYNVSPNQTLSIVEGSTLSSEEFEQNDFVVYPNPTSGIVNIKSKKNQDYSLMIFDAIGRKVYSQKYKNLLNSINISNLSKGIYFFNFSFDDAEFSKKVILH